MPLDTTQIIIFATAALSVGALLALYILKKPTSPLGENIIKSSDVKLGPIFIYKGLDYDTATIEEADEGKHRLWLADEESSRKAGPIFIEDSSFKFIDPIQAIFNADSPRIEIIDEEDRHNLQYVEISAANEAIREKEKIIDKLNERIKQLVKKVDEKTEIAQITQTNLEDQMSKESKPLLDTLKGLMDLQNVNKR